MPKKSSEVKPWEPADKAALAEVIGHLFDLQKQFGKTTGQLENVVAGFCWAMASYPAQEVIRGFGEYIKHHADMPTPSDIVKIIDPKPEKIVYDKQIYYKYQQILKEEGPFGLNGDQIEYCRDYEEAMLKAAKRTG